MVSTVILNLEAPSDADGTTSEISPAEKSLLEDSMAQKLPSIEKFTEWIEFEGKRYKAQLTARRLRVRYVRSEGRAFRGVRVALNHPVDEMIEYNTPVNGLEFEGIGLYGAPAIKLRWRSPLDAFPDEIFCIGPDVPSASAGILARFVEVQAAETYRVTVNRMFDLSRLKLDRHNSAEELAKSTLYSAALAAHDDKLAGLAQAWRAVRAKKSEELLTEEEAEELATCVAAVDAYRALHR